MKLFNCIVSLGMNNGGPNPHHELNKFSIPKAEVVLLRAIHGKDAVKNIEHAGYTDKSDDEIYHDLADELTGYPKYAGLIEKLFHVKLADIQSDLDDIESLEEGLGGDPVVDRGADDNGDIDVAASIPDFMSKQPIRTPVK